MFGFAYLFYEIKFQTFLLIIEFVKTNTSVTFLLHQPTLKLKIAFAICLVCWHGFALCLLALVSPSLCLSRRWPPSLSQSWFLSLYACGFASLFACECLLRAWLLACLRACLRCFQQACLFVFCAAGVLQLTCPSQSAQSKRNKDTTTK